MPNYKTPEGTLAVWVDEGADPAEFGNGLVPCTDEEAAAIMAALVPVPQAVDMAQARLALLGVGITEAMVNAAIAAMPEGQREVADIEWRFRTTVRRDSALVTALGASLGLTNEQIDALFTTAATL